MQQLKRFLIFVIQNTDKESGATVVMFAIMFPLLLMFYSMAFDSASIQADRARLADGMNQGTLAVALMDNRNKSEADRQANIKLLRHYLEYYLPNADIPVNDLDIFVALDYHDNARTDIKSVNYSASGTAVVHPTIAEKSGGKSDLGFNKNINISADSSNGVVRKTLEKVKHPTDYVFVVDFSGSMRRPSAEKGMTRIQLLHKVVTEFATAVLQDNEKTTIGIVPFSIGVPVVLNEKNEVGGYRFGCSWVGKLKPEYQNVDLAFWYNKNQLPNVFLSEKKQSYYHDKALYEHYKKVMGPATGKNIEKMVAEGWCVKNEESGATAGKAEYSCDADPRANLFDNYPEFISTRSAALSLMVGVKNHLSIANIITMDFDSTLADNGYMFSENAVTTYTHYHAQPFHQPFSPMCNSALPTNVKSAQLAQLMKTMDKPKSYLIELTSDPDVLRDFANMDVLENAATDSSSGLLRSLPVIAKGVNTRKIIIIVSDGDDEGDSKRGPQAMTNKLHKEYKICDRIKDGLLKYPVGTKTTDSDIYFISVVDDKEHNSGIDFWSKNCVGRDNAIIAKNYQELMSSLIKITQKGIVNFVSEK